MNEMGFRIWLQHIGISRKVQSDLVSRIKKLEREFENCDIDEEFQRDGCAALLALFQNKGQNEEMGRLATANLPIGKSYLSAYKYALKKYVDYLIATNK